MKPQHMRMPSPDHPGSLSMSKPPGTRAVAVSATCWPSSKQGAPDLRSLRLLNHGGEEEGQV